VPPPPEWTWSEVAAATCEVYREALEHCRSLPAVRSSVHRGRDQQPSRDHESQQPGAPV